MKLQGDLTCETNFDVHQFADGDEFTAKIEDRATDLFEPKSGKPQLQVTRLCRNSDGDNTFCVVKNQDVSSGVQLGAIAEV
jgi:hypothetical protein